MKQYIVSMHFVLWGTSQRDDCISPWRPSCVSMHFVLWGTSQRFSKVRCRKRSKRFNALRALGYFSTNCRENIAAQFSFQCTSCFGVLLNWPIGCTKPVGFYRFNALRALGYFSTNGMILCHQPTVSVSMHFVLWGTSQPTKSSKLQSRMLGFNALRALGYFSTFRKSKSEKRGICFNALRALGYFSTAVDFRHLNSLFLLGHFCPFPTPHVFTPLKIVKSKVFMIQLQHLQ